MTQWRTMMVGLVAVGLVAGVAAGGAQAQGKGDPAKGKDLYMANKCQTCHGDAGKGDGPQGQKLKDKPSDWSAGGGGLKGLDDAKIFDSIKKGGQAIGKSRAMPAAPKLSDDEVNHIVAYVKSLAK